MPDWLSWDFWAKDSQSLNHLALIIAGVIGIPLLAIRTFAANKSAKAADAQARTAEQGHITDRFTAAVEQLGSEKMAVRLGGIYALERISRDSRRDHWTIMETLTAYVREHAPWPPRQPLGNPFVQLQAGSAGSSAEREAPRGREDETNDESTHAEELTAAWQELHLGDELSEQQVTVIEELERSAQIRPATDIQAVLTVLGRRDETARKLDQAARRQLGLQKTDLRGANLVGAHLEDAFLEEAHLERAILEGAHLQGANLAFAHLERAILWGAHLGEAFLEGAQLEDADLRAAVGLTGEQLADAFGNENTKVADELRPSNWPAATPDEPDNAR